MITVYPAAALIEQQGTEGWEGANVLGVDEWEEAASLLQRDLQSTSEKEH